MLHPQFGFWEKFFDDLGTWNLQLCQKCAIPSTEKFNRNGNLD